MRTLNRPMFRYGGPIKEGIMNGIREPAAHGGSMGAQFNTGLVGDQRYPKTGGREHHGLNFIPSLLSLGARTVGTAAARRAAQEAATRAALSGGATQAAKNAAGKGITGAAPGFWRSAWEGDPIVRSAKWLKNAIMSPTAKGWGQKIVKGSVSPTGLLTTGGISYMFWPDGTPKTKEEIAATKGNIPGLTSKSKKPGENSDMSWVDPEKAAARAKEAEAENRIKQMEKYKEIMNIKGMKKDAVYKSLVDVSKQIQEGGSLKEQLKSGSLISNLTQAASKRFDKVADTETALRSLVAKGEIENELNKGDKELKRKELRARIAVSEKALSGETLQESINAGWQKTGKFASGSNLAGLARTKGIEITKVLPIKDIPKGTSAIDYVTDIVNLSHQKGKPFPQGYYVIGERLVIIDDQGTVTPYI